MFGARCASVLLAATSLFPVPVWSAPDPGPALAPQMDFVPTPAGTYELQRIQQCPDAVLLNASAGARRLSAYTRGKVTLLTFFYTYCTDPWGCPFAYQTMKGLRDRIAADARCGRACVSSTSASIRRTTRPMRCEVTQKALQARRDSNGNFLPHVRWPNSRRCSTASGRT